MSSRSYGRSLEKRAEAILKADGATVHRARLAAVFIGPGRVVGQTNDPFACDLEAVHRDWSFTLRVQVTTANGPHVADRRRKIEAIWAPLWSPKVARANRLEVWAWGRWAGRGYAFKVRAYRGRSRWIETGFRSGRGRGGIREKPSPEA